MADARERVLAALSEIIAERGLDQVTVREVAATAGVSIGAVQYHCPTKDEMLSLALQDMYARIRDRVAAIERAGPVMSVLRRVILEFLPLDERRRREARIYLAFVARAAVSPYLAEVQHDWLTEFRGQIRRAYELAVERGEVVAAVDPESAAVATVVLIDGLTVQLISDPTGLSAETATGLVDALLDRHGARLR